MPTKRSKAAKKHPKNKQTAYHYHPAAQAEAIIQDDSQSPSPTEEMDRTILEAQQEKCPLM